MAKKTKRPADTGPPPPPTPRPPTPTLPDPGISEKRGAVGRNAAR